MRWLLPRASATRNPVGPQLKSAYVEGEKDSCARARFNGPPRAHSPTGRKKRARERIVPGTLTHMRATRNARGKDFFLSLSIASTCWAQVNDYAQREEEGKRVEQGSSARQ